MITELDHVESFLGDPGASGNHREVYELGDDKVLKVSYDGNSFENAVKNQATYERKGIEHPETDIFPFDSPEYGRTYIIVQERADSVPGNQSPEDIDFFLEGVTETLDEHFEKSVVYDARLENFGQYGDRVLPIDFTDNEAFIAFPEPEDRTQEDVDRFIDACKSIFAGLTISARQQTGKSREEVVEIIEENSRYIDSEWQDGPIPYTGIEEKTFTGHEHRMAPEITGGKHSRMIS